MNVTFDSNVWERVVSCEERDCDSFVGIKGLITSGAIKPYIREVALSLESIFKKDRWGFTTAYKPKVEMVSESYSNGKIRGTICFSPDNEKHLGLHPVLLENLDAARKIGFKVLIMTNIGTARAPQIPDSMKISFDNTEEFWEYAQRLSDCSKYIRVVPVDNFLIYKNIIRLDRPN